MTRLFPYLVNNRKAAIFATIGIGIVLFLLPIVAGYFGNFWVRVMAMALLYVMLALGLNIVVGFAGLLDLGYVAFYAVGAYTYALLCSPHLSDNFEWLQAMFPDGLHMPIYDPKLKRSHDESWHVELMDSARTGLPYGGMAPLTRRFDTQDIDMGARATEFARNANPSETRAYDIGGQFNSFLSILNRGVGVSA